MQADKTDKTKFCQFCRYLSPSFSRVRTYKQGNPVILDRQNRRNLRSFSSVSFVGLVDAGSI